MVSSPSLGIIVACHNEELYIGRCLKAIFSSLEGTKFNAKVLVILDCCIDKSAEIASQFPVESFVKNGTTWENSYAENLEIGFKKFIDYDYVSVIDADVLIPREFFTTMITTLETESDLVSVASDLITERSTPFNRAYRIYEVFFKRMSLGGSLRGACRIYRGAAIHRLSQGSEMTMIDDFIAPDSRLDQKIGGKRRSIPSVKSLHMRRINFTKCIQGQKNAGRARKQLNLSFSKTVLHGIFRLRPFVIVGYLSHDNKKTKENAPTIGRDKPL
ncbi:MAG: glycosyltransferase [Nitrososphaerota archaeon]|nr:glycosyltransferase [Nitrososphaerota archaeon]